MSNRKDGTMLQYCVMVIKAINNEDEIKEKMKRKGFNLEPFAYPWHEST